jgi:hypothetical protein
MDADTGSIGANGESQSAVPKAQRTSLENEVDRASQALFDLAACGASELVLVECDTEPEEDELIEQLLTKARNRGFVGARVSLSEVSFEALDDVVRAVIQNLSLPSRAKLAETPGLITLLDYYMQKNGREGSAALLGEQIEAHGVHGDLAALALAYVTAEGEPKKELREFQAWMMGTNLSRTRTRAVARGSLMPKTAKRALSDLSRLIRALGWSGCLLCFSGADAIANRTPRQREKAFTVLRELVDNFDSDRGMTATRISVSGKRDFFEGPRSVQSLAPLLSRLHVPTFDQPAPPHRSWVTLGAKKSAPRAHNLAGPEEDKRRATSALIRISQGLPPTEAVSSMSVGYEKIDAMIEQLFEHAAMSGSVFSVLTGDYGTGKTHLLLHLTDRALERRHPVFRLNLERLNFDLGNPQRHLGRLLDQSILPKRGRPSALDLLHTWTRSPNKLRLLTRTLEELALVDGEAGKAAQKVLLQSARAKDPGQVLEATLAGRDLYQRPATMSYRHDAYARLLLWLKLLESLENCQGPVVLIDEAENLYTAGISRGERRTALRSLSFYCGGALPSACVILAITPKVLREMKRDSAELLSDITEQRTVLEWEDAEMLRRRLSRLAPQPVPEFSKRHRTELAERVRATHRKVRGPVEDQGWDAAVRRAARAETSPRELVRSLMDRLERIFWQSQLGLD